jgi:hypothetical protein
VQYALVAYTLKRKDKNMETQDSKDKAIGDRVSEYGKILDELGCDAVIVSVASKQTGRFTGCIKGNAADLAELILGILKRYPQIELGVVLGLTLRISKSRTDNTNL